MSGGLINKTRRTMIDSDDFDAKLVKVVNHIASGNKVLVVLDTEDFGFRSYLVIGILLNAIGRVDAESEMYYSDDNGMKNSVILDPENIEGFWLEV